MTFHVIPDAEMRSGITGGVWRGKLNTVIPAQAGIHNR
jgi:hypothetical protein